MNKLEEICARKAEHVIAQKSKTPLKDLKARLGDAEPPRGFERALRNKYNAGEIALIAEVKKASPSKGVIREDFNPVQIAQIYEANGASCLSVLTDEPYFQGKDEYFTSIRSAVKIPMLRKDFMIDPYQIYESRALGADCILLILAALSDEQAREMHDIAVDLGMDVLTEAHDAEEIARGIELGESILGVNSRNLKTLDVNLQTALDLGKEIPASRLKIAESGIAHHDDVERLKASNYQGFLIGESLMRQDDIANATQKILGQN